MYHWLLCIFLIVFIIAVADNLGAAPHTQISFKALIKQPSSEVQVQRVVNYRILTSLVSHLRLFKSLRYLEHSPLINYVLNPRTKDFKLPDIALDPLISKVSIPVIF